MITSRKLVHHTLLYFAFGGNKMVQKRRKTGYSLGIMKKQGLFFKDLCTMYFKNCEANGISIYTKIPIFLR